MLLLLPDLISKCMYATDDDDDDPSQTAQNGKLFSLPAELISSNRVSRDGPTKSLLRPGIQGSIAQATDAEMVVEIRVLTEKFGFTLHPIPDTDHFLQTCRNPQASEGPFRMFPAFVILYRTTFRPVNLATTVFIFLTLQMSLCCCCWKGETPPNLNS